MITDICATVAVTILVDNNAAPPFSGEHGFSVYIECDGKKILFDAGQGAALFDNAAALGISLTDLDILILSHGHYDHTGAVSEILHLNQKIIVYAGSGAFQRRFNLKDRNHPKDISISEKNRQAISSLDPERFVLLNAPLKISEHCLLTGPIPRNTTFEDVSGAFYFDAEGTVRDDIYDETALCLFTGRGEVIITGCAHAGIVNTATYIRTLNEKSHIHAIVGGFHLHSASKRRMEMTASFLNLCGADLLIPCHCTGANAIDYLTKNVSAEITVGHSGFSRSF